MPIYYLSFHAEPTLEHVNANELGGAYINCWIESNNINEAEQLAIQKIKTENWQHLNLEEAFEVNKNSYEDNPKGLKFFRQALIDKEVYVFYTYPNNEEN